MLLRYSWTILLLAAITNDARDHTNHGSQQTLNLVSALEVGAKSPTHQQQLSDKIDFIFPAPSHEEQRNLNTQKQHTDTQPSSKLSEAQLLEKRQLDLRSLFQWHKLDTNKCSKPCGLGYKIVQWFCQDIKYQVRVEDSLCETGAGLPKPANLSDATCSEFPCPIQWHTGSWSSEACQSAISTSNASPTATICQTITSEDQSSDISIQVPQQEANETRKVFCAYVDAGGNTIELFEGACDGQERPTPTRSCPQRLCPVDARAPIAGRSVSPKSLSNSVDHLQLSTNSEEQHLSGNAEHPIGVYDDTLDDSAHREHRASVKSISASRKDEHYHVMNQNAGTRISGHESRREVELPFDDDNIISMIPMSSAPPQFDIFNSPDAVAQLSTTSSATTKNKNTATIDDNNKQVSDSADVKTATSNEPYYATGPWSACDATCGPVPTLGARHRDLSCKMTLQASGFTVDMPDFSCAGLAKPATTETCKSESCPANDPVETSNTNVPDEHMATEKQQQQQSELMNQTNNEDDIMRARQVNELTVSSLNNRFMWREDGWTQCSAECLGGLQENMVVCWDTADNTTVDASLCPLALKLETYTQTCNDHPCNPQWQLGQWTECSHDCGALGVTTRRLRCVQEISRGQGNVITLSNDLCLATGAPMPSTREPCNRIHCKPAWSVGPWSECQLHHNHHESLTSSSPLPIDVAYLQQEPEQMNNKKLACGVGTRTRNITCQREFAAQPNDDMSWRAGKLSQVPFEVCFNEYRTAPTLDLNCHIKCQKTNDDAALAARSRIESVPYQNYTMPKGVDKADLKIGGRAQLLRGSTVRIFCKVVNQKGSSSQARTSDSEEHLDSLYGSLSNVIDDFHLPDWRLNGTKIFQAGTMRAQKKKLQVPSNQQTSPDYTTDSTRDFYFSPARSGRFRLTPKGTLKIKNLQSDDSGTYTCTIGRETEAIVIDILRPRKASVGLAAPDLTYEL